jgi:hypothetical protein
MYFSSAGGGLEDAEEGGDVPAVHIVVERRGKRPASSVRFRRRIGGGGERDLAGKGQPPPSSPAPNSARVNLEG